MNEMPLTRRAIGALLGFNLLKRMRLQPENCLVSQPDIDFLVFHCQMIKLLHSSASSVQEPRRKAWAIHCFVGRNVTYQRSKHYF